MERKGVCIYIRIVSLETTVSWSIVWRWNGETGENETWQRSVAAVRSNSISRWDRKTDEKWQREGLSFWPWNENSRRGDTRVRAHIYIRTRIHVYRGGLRLLAVSLPLHTVAPKNRRNRVLHHVDSPRWYTHILREYRIYTSNLSSFRYSRLRFGKIIGWGIDSLEYFGQRFVSVLITLLPTSSVNRYKIINKIHWNVRYTIKLIVYERTYWIHARIEPSRNTFSHIVSIGKLPLSIGCPFKSMDHFYASIPRRLFFNLNRTVYTDA